MPNKADKFVDFVDGIRVLLGGQPAVRTADDYDRMAQEYANALLAGDEAEAARLAQALGTAKVRGELALPNEADLATMAERFPEDRNILGGPVKTRGQSEALSLRPDVGGLRFTEDMTVQDAIDLQTALNKGSILRGTLNTQEMSMGNPQDELMAFFGNKAQRRSAGLNPDLTPTRGDMADQDIINTIRGDQLSGIAGEAAETLSNYAEILPRFTMRTDSRTGLPPMPNLSMKDILKIAGGGVITGGLAYLLSQMRSAEESQEENSQESEADIVVDADPQPPQDGDPTGLAAAAEAEASEMDEMVSDIGTEDPLGDQQLPGRTMDADYLRELMAGFKEKELEDSPSDTADLVAESRPIPASTPVVVSQRTVYRQPRRRTYRRTSRGRRPNYGYSRAMNPSQRSYRRRR